MNADQQAPISGQQRVLNQLENQRRGRQSAGAPGRARVENESLDAAEKKIAEHEANIAVLHNRIAELGPTADPVES